MTGHAIPNFLLRVAIWMVAVFFYVLPLFLESSGGPQANAQENDKSVLAFRGVASVL